jgi:hypothetical protein
MDGLELVRRLQKLPHPSRVIVITAHGSERYVVEAMKAGAYDYFRKPFDVDELLAVVGRALEAVRLRHDNERLAGELNLSRSLVFASEAMSRLAQLVQRAGPRDVTVLIAGESGTGKERMAEALVRASPRGPALPALQLCRAHTGAGGGGAVRARTGGDLELLPAPPSSAPAAAGATAAGPLIEGVRHRLPQERKHRASERGQPSTETVTRRRWDEVRCSHT